MATWVRYQALVAWHILILGYHDDDELHSVIERAEIANAPQDVVYYDYRRLAWIGIDELPTSRYELLMTLIHAHPELGVTLP